MPRGNSLGLSRPRTMTHKTPVHLWLHGYSGRMGLELQQAVSDTHQSLRVIGGSDKAHIFVHPIEGRPLTHESLGAALSKSDMIFDFSTPEGNSILLGGLNHAKLTKKYVLVGTTGLTKGSIRQWRELANHQGFAVLMAPNTSLGIMLTLRLGLQLAETLVHKGFDLELIESHHRNKVDAPSGTAKFLAEELARSAGLSTIYGRSGKRGENELGIASLRGGSVFGEHTLQFLGDSEELTISHRALSRSVFAKGAVVLGQWLLRQQPGFYGLTDIHIADLNPKAAP